MPDAASNQLYKIPFTGLSTFRNSPTGGLSMQIRGGGGAICGVAGIDITTTVSEVGAEVQMFFVTFKVYTPAIEVVTRWRSGF